MKNHRSDHVFVAAGLAFTIGLLGAYSSDASGDKPNANASNTVKSAEDTILISAQCTHDKGSDMLDTGLTTNSLSGTSDAFNDAINECQQKVGPALDEENDLTKDLTAQEQLVKGAKYLCDLGYDIVDPEVGKGLSVRDIPSSALQKHFSSQRTQTK